MSWLVENGYRFLLAARGSARVWVYVSPMSVYTRARVCIGINRELKIRVVVSWRRIADEKLLTHPHTHTQTQTQFTSAHELFPSNPCRFGGSYVSLGRSLASSQKLLWQSSSWFCALNTCSSNSFIASSSQSQSSPSSWWLLPVEKRRKEKAKNEKKRNGEETKSEINSQFWSDKVKLSVNVK